jgi:hypothetical protein
LMEELNHRRVPPNHLIEGLAGIERSVLLLFAGKGFVVFNLDEFFASSSMIRCSLLAFSIARFWSAKNLLRRR